jgi:hypothetical protein
MRKVPLSWAIARLRTVVPATPRFAFCTRNCIRHVALYSPLVCVAVTYAPQNNGELADGPFFIVSCEIISNELAINLAVIVVNYLWTVKVDFVLISFGITRIDELFYEVINRRAFFLRRGRRGSWCTLLRCTSFYNGKERLTATAELNANGSLRSGPKISQAANVRREISPDAFSDVAAIIDYRERDRLTVAAPTLPVAVLLEHLALSKLGASFRDGDFPQAVVKTVES